MLVAAVWCGVGLAEGAPAPAATNQAAPATAPAAAAAYPEVQAALEALRKAAASFVPDLGANQQKKREQAQAAGAALVDGLFDAMLQNAQWDDPEQRLRLKRGMEAAAVSVRRGDFYASYPPDKRQVLRKLEAEALESFRRLFDASDRTVANAVKELAARGEAGELIVLWSIQHPGLAVRMSGIQAAGAIKGPPKRVLDALFDRLAALDRSQDSRTARFGGDDEDDVPSFMYPSRDNEIETRSLYKTLTATKDERLLPFLLNKLFGASRFSFYGRSSDLAGYILALKDDRTIVTLADRITEGRDLGSIRFGDSKTSVTLKLGDLAMGIILLQTGQRLKDYSFYERDEHFGPWGESGISGFESDAKRRQGQEKFRKWWQANQAKYKDAKPIPLSKDKPEEGPPPFVF